ncbi:MAG: hypothetical protein JSV56_01175, partial [Methanomassiliicoccales archaeon]
DRNDDQEALSISKELPTEYRTMQGILTNIIKALLDELTPLIFDQQRRITEDIETEIIEGNRDKARQLLNDKTDYYSEIHDIYVEFVARLISYLYRHHRDKGLYDVLKTIGEKQKERFLKAMSLPVETVVKNSAMIMKSHPRGKLKIEEDFEKFIFICDPCGSGGYLLDGGFYDSPNALALVKEPQRMTWNNKDFPSYCVHCSIWNEILPIEWKGYPYWVHRPPRFKNDKCTFYIFKDPQNIPKDYLIHKRKTESDVSGSG